MNLTHLPYNFVLAVRDPYCKKCGRNLANAKQLDKFYGCDTCDSWVSEIVMIERQLFNMRNVV